MSIEILHLSDLHFQAYPRSVHEWVSKRALGALNWFLKRQKKYPKERITQLIQKTTSLSWDHVVVSGDLTQLSLEAEFAEARQALAPLLTHSERATIVPGNHDYYVPEALAADYFQQYFGEFFGEGVIHTRYLGEDWHIIGWNSAHPNPWYSAAGTVTRATFVATERYIGAQAPGAKFVIVNHYPIWFPAGRLPEAEHELLNLAQVQHWLSTQPQVRLYLHGHLHRNWSHTLRYPTHELQVVNSASSTMLMPAGASSFHRLRLEKDEVTVEPFAY
jgi:3',5'-cyclic AMP phosphodiesterase CpdA